ncbi:MAG: hypothetical protein RIC89_03205 [Pseudomonadales bacterium]
MKRFLRLVIGAGVTSALLCLGFALYLMSHGLDVAAGLVNLLRPHPAPVASNPPMAQLHGYEVVWLGNLDSYDINESSGLTTSRVHPNTLWTLNDSGSEPRLFAMDTSGRLQGVFDVPGLDAFDWESMDAFNYQGTPALLIADTGDNLRWRSSVYLHIVAEPQTLAATGQLQLLHSIEVTYPDGPRDSEAVAVDTARDRILMLSKRRHPPELYAIPLDSGRAVTARKVATLDHWPRPTEADYEHFPKLAPYMLMPTGMDVFADKLLITTYQPAFLYDLRQLDAVQHIDMPRFGQREAVSFNLTGDQALLTRERTKDAFAAEIIAIRFSPGGRDQPDNGVGQPDGQ